jgi:hypothetical protein
MNTLYVNYTRTGQAIPDHLVEKELFDQAGYCINGQDKQFNVSTENVIIAVRAMKLSERITCNVQIMFEGEILPMNKYCCLDEWPKGFCDYIDKWATETVKFQMKKYRFNIDQN